MEFNLADETHIPSCPVEALYHLTIRLKHVAGTQNLDNSSFYANGMEKRAVPEGFKLLTPDSTHDPLLALPSCLSEEMKPLQS